MSTENNNINKTQLLLPSQTSDKKTLVLDLDETLVHSQFMTFSTPSDVVIQIEIENEMHDINVMIRPGVKEFLENMEKYYEIVIFTASVSKYADPLLDIIDKKGYCPYRLFREHCSLINTTFVKDLQRLGRDLKDIVIVDNSPLSYSLHPKNGLPILTWFEDKSDRELFEIMPILEFLSNVPDVREFIPKFVGLNNKINYGQANEFIRNYTGQKNTFPEKKDEETKKNNLINQNKDNEINPNSNNQNIIQNKNNNNDNKENIELNKNNYINTNKESIGTNKNKLVDLAMKNIIASVSPDSISGVNNDINKNQNLKNKGDSKSKINSNNQKNKNNEEKKSYKNKNNMKIELVNNCINVKKLSNKNNKAHSTKKFKSTITETNFKTKQKRQNYSSGGNFVKGASAHINSDSKSIILKTDNKLNGLVKSKNATPKINKSINLINKNSHTTRSVKYTKKNDNYILISNSNNNNNNNNINVNIKMSKSLTKTTFNKKDNIIQNKNTKNSCKSYNSTSISNELSNHKNQKSSNDFRSSQENIKIKQKNSAEKPKMTNKKIEKKELLKNKNNFLKTGFIQNKLMNNKMNNINMNLSNNLSLSNKFNANHLNINGFDYTKTNRGTNQIKFTLTNSNILKSNCNKNYSPNNRYNKKSLDKNMINNNINNNQTQLLKKKNSHKNNSVTNDKISNINKIKEINNVNGLNRIKTARPKSSCTDFDNKVNNFKNKNIFDNKKNKLKYQNKMKSEINEILQKRGISGKINDLKKEYKKI